MKALYDPAGERIGGINSPIRVPASADAWVHDAFLAWAIEFRPAGHRFQVVQRQPGRRDLKPDGCLRTRNDTTPSPMVQLNDDDYYECLTPETTVQLLESCKQGRPGPMVS